MERYRSGHNGADSKSVCAQAHEGSNPSLSAKRKNITLCDVFSFGIGKDSNKEGEVAQVRLRKKTVRWTVFADVA